MDNITRFPVVPRPLPPRARVIPIREPSATDSKFATETLQICRRDIEHAIKKAAVVADCLGESAWLVRLLDAEIAKIKDKLGENNGG